MKEKVTSVLNLKLKDKTNQVIIAICIISLLLNFIGVWWGTPYKWHPDEVTIYVLEMAKRMDMKPYNFIVGSLHKYIVGLALLPYYLKLRLTGEINRIPLTLTPPYTNEQFKLMTNALLISRAISVIMGALIVLFVYLIATEVYDKKSALSLHFF